MKTSKILILSLLAGSALAFTACSDDEPNKSISVITPGNTEENDFDRWLLANFNIPYNIDFKYRYEDIQGDFDYYLVPAEYESAIKMAHMVKHLCVETYNEVAGKDFTCQYFPKMFFLTGEWEYKNNGSFILGTAEGGRKIFLAGINYLPRYIGSAEDLNHYYFKTIHHEFSHILNQTKPGPHTSSADIYRTIRRHLIRRTLPKCCRYTLQTMKNRGTTWLTVLRLSQGPRYSRNWKTCATT